MSREAGAPRSGCLALTVLGAALTAFCGFGFAATAAAAPETFEVEPQLSSTEFAVSQLGFFKQHGRFGRTQGRIVLDAEDHTGSVDLVVDAASIDTGWGLRDSWLRGEDMFDVTHYPAMRFRSTQLVFEQMRLIRVAGLLTLRDVTRPIALRIERMRCGRESDGVREGCGADAVSTIRRSEFGMTYALGLVGDEVSLSFQVMAYRVRP